MRLKDRDWLVRINGHEFDALDIHFKIKKSLRPEPNTCSLTIFNLSAEIRNSIEELNLYDPKRVRGQKAKAGTKKTTRKGPKVGHIRVEIEAGYKEQRSLVFQGDLRRAVTTKEPPDIATEIEGEDGGRTYLTSRISESYPPGTPRLAVVAACAAAMGLGLGNIVTVRDRLQDRYPSGTMVSGQASDILRGVLRGARLSYSIQNGVLQFLGANEGLQTVGYLLNIDTGLVKSPVVDSAGGLMVTTLMIPDMAPGAYIQLDSQDHKGTYLVKSVETTGQTDGDDWHHELECFPA